MIHQKDFTKDFLSWITSYSTSCKQLVQIDVSLSDRLPRTFDMPRGSILGPMIFNLYANDQQSHFQSISKQYTDDIMIYETCKPKEIQKVQYQLNE